jgi:alkylated DNA repair dioxygenase AlkB
VSLSWQATLFGAKAPGVDPAFAGIRRVALDDTAWVDHLPGWLCGPDEVMDVLVRTAPWRANRRPMYDRIVAVPRLIAWFRAGADDVPPIVEVMLAALSDRYAIGFTSCGCNLYRDGHDSVAWHGDRIPAEVVDPIVAIVSVGEPRKLLLRPVGGGTSTRFDLGHGDLLVMGGSSQRTWQHAVPKVAAAGPRMSITFRHGVDAPDSGQ